MSSARSTGLRHYLPDPGRLWICHAPVSWPGADGLWVHLGERTLGRAGAGSLPDIEPPSEADLTYLPLVEPGLQADLERLVERFESSGVPVLIQCRPGEAGKARGGVLDLLEVLLLEGAEGLKEIETGCRTAVWPLIAGLTDSVEEIELGIDGLAEAGVDTVIGLVLELSALDRRRLAEFVDEDGYQVLFHGESADERALVRSAVRRGLEVFPARPDLGASPRHRFGRKVGEELLKAAELWLRLGRSESAGQDLLRAARWVERSQHDLQALAREGNLGVLPWLDVESAGVVEDLAAGRASALATRLMAEYLETS